jgi:hypothetical protein
MHVSYSEVDSHRFGYRIGRAKLDAEWAQSPDTALLAAACDGFDIVILRAPGDEPLVASALAAMTGWRAFTADHLLYWEWPGGDLDNRPVPEGFRIEFVDDPAVVTPLLRATFVGYVNHYAANPLLDRAGALDGYVEWAEGLIAGDSTTTVVFDSADRAIAFAILDWSVSPADIRLAGVHPEAQSAGWYGRVIRGLLSEAVARQSLPVHISTQSANTRVMRAWVRLGFAPFQTLATYHVVTEELWAARLP